MGYFISKLQKGCEYELDGVRLQFDEKKKGSFYFYICKFNFETLSYEKTDMVASYSNKELEFLKRVNGCSTSGALKRVGRDKVFARY
jgi:hypothetical protein